MKKVIFAFLMVFSAVFCAVAADKDYIEEVESLGYVAGQGLACEAQKYDTFEMLARAILISKAKSDAMQEEGMRIFNAAKAESFITKIRDGFSNCGQIADSFDHQIIFKSVLYGDGTIKMPDGKIVKPRQIYDSTLIYEKDPDLRNKMMKFYQERYQQIHQDPNYQKALRERQSKDNL